ncbi:SAP domain-containing ribonucleoprotein-like isoform X1 [Polypterus senegalus]|uniref:SAP domain-containing ribonucleoprotein-like isoform X1 n=1 Tax=Polypterus senegalus TaxID=55291 RepID=UPI001964FD8F|nr:SAP domain-containing ribonucleoprotein-like isoform X1 [Polypterus senegalus]
MCTSFRHSGASPSAQFCRSGVRRLVLRMSVHVGAKGAFVESSLAAVRLSEWSAFAALEEAMKKAHLEKLMTDVFGEEYKDEGEEEELDILVEADPLAEHSLNSKKTNVKMVRHLRDSEKISNRIDRFGVPGGSVAKMMARAQRFGLLDSGDAAVSDRVDEGEEEDDDDEELDILEEDDAFPEHSVTFKKVDLKTIQFIPEDERIKRRSKRFGAPVSSLAKKMARAVRFGLPTFDDSAISHPVADQERFRKRKERFGAVLDTVAILDEQVKKKMRAERFGMAAGVY